MGVVIVTVATAAFLWWNAEAPEAVDLEAAVAQLEAASLGDVGAASTTQPSEGAGVTSTTGPDAAETVGARDLTVSDHASSKDTGAEVKTTSTVTAPVAETADAVGDTSGTASEASETTSGAGATDGAPSTEVFVEETTSASLDVQALAGLWTVATSESAEGLPGEPAVSFAGFRVVEVLAGGIAESTAVGRTADLFGSIELAGANLVAARVEVALATLRTDNSHRDSHMRQALDTNRFPLAVFTLVEPVELPVGVFREETFSGTASGDLTIKGVTNRAVFDLGARLVGDTIVVAGSSEVVFGDYGVPTPTSASVISVEDHGAIEFLLYFTRRP